MASQFKKKPSTENFANAWPIFILGLLIASFFGGAVQTLLSPKQIRLWVEKQIQKQDLKYNIQFEDAHLNLADGLFPRLGVFFSGISLKSKDICKNNESAIISQLYIPIEFVELLQGRIQIRELVIEEMQLEKLAKVCSSELEAPAVLQDSPSKENLASPEAAAERVKLKSNSISELVQSLDQVRPWIGGIKINNFKLFLRDQTSVELQNLDFSMAETPYVFSAFVQPTGRLQFLSNLGPIEVKVQLEKDFARGQSYLKIREGHMDFKWTWIFASQQFSITGNLHTVPAATLYQVAHSADLVKDEISLHSQWLSCDFLVSGQVDHISDMLVKTETCSLEGDIGKLHLAASEFYPLRETFEFKPVELKLEKINLKKILEFVKRKGPSGILSHFGEINGEIQVESKDKVHFQGSIENLEFKFSNRSVRAKQPVASAKGAIHLEDGRLSGVIDEVALDDGKFIGLISFNVDKSFREGIFQVKIDQLSLHSTVQNLMASGQVEPFAIYGQGRMENGEIVYWSGDFGTSGMSGASWSLTDVKLKSVFQNSQFKGQVRARQFKLASDHLLFKRLRPLYLDYEKIKDEMVFSRLSTSLALEKEFGHWDRAVAYDDQGEIIFSSAGDWDIKNGLKGWIDVDFPVLKLLRWEIFGPAQDPQLQPSPKMLKDLARKNPSLKLPEDWLKRSEDLLVPSQDESQLSKFSKKVVETAKKILPESVQGDQKNMDKKSEEAVEQ